MPNKSSKKYTYTIGRRKSAVAILKFFPGTAKSKSTVNGKPVDKYFQTDKQISIYQQPQKITKTASKYYFEAKLTGSGLVSQAEALALAIARALDKIDTATFRPILKPVGLLTVDARVRQRRMVGTGGKARRAKQSPKR